MLKKYLIIGITFFTSIMFFTTIAYQWESILVYESTLTILFTVLFTLTMAFSIYTLWVVINTYKHHPDLIKRLALYEIVIILYGVSILVIASLLI